MKNWVRIVNDYVVEISPEGTGYLERDRKLRSKFSEFSEGQGVPLLGISKGEGR